MAEKPPELKVLIEEIPIAAAGVNTYGLGVAHETYPDGKEYWKYMLPDVVQVVPIDPNGLVIAIEEKREGQTIATRKVVGGTVEENEPPLVTVARETLEETGYLPQTIAQDTKILAVLRGEASVSKDFEETLLTKLGGSVIHLANVQQDTRSNRVIGCYILVDCVPALGGQTEKEIPVSQVGLETLLDELTDRMLTNPKAITRPTIP